MWIREILISGFGILNDVSLTDIPRGLVVFTGENESGKTTLMHFIRTMLFGFPKKGKREFYPPLRAGRHGGTLVMSLEHGGELTITRTISEKSFKQNGKDISEEELRELLGNLDRESFVQAFSVGLEDIQGLKRLYAGGFASRLFDTAAGLGPVSLADVMKSMENRMEELLRQRSKEAHINRLIDQLHVIRRNIRDVQQKISTYEGLLHEAESLSIDIHRLAERKQALSAELAYINKLVEAYQPWKEWRECVAELTECEHAGSFPKDGLAKLRAYKGTIQELIGNLELSRKEIAQIEEELKETQPNPLLLENEDAITSLVERREVLERSMKRLPELEARRESVEGELSELVGEGELPSILSIENPRQLRLEARPIVEEISAHRSKLSRIEALIEQKKKDIDGQKGSLLADIERFESCLSTVESLNELTRRQEIDRKRIVHIPLWGICIALGVLVLSVIALGEYPAAAVPTIIVSGVSLLSLLYLKKRQKNQTEKLKKSVEELSRTLARIESLGFQVERESLDRFQKKLVERIQTHRATERVVRQHEEELRELDSRAEELRERIGEAGQRWRCLLDEHKLPPSLEPTEIESFLSKAESVREKWSLLKSLESEIEATRNYIAEVQASIKQVLGTVHVPSKEQESSTDIIEMLRQRLEEARELKEKRKRLHSRLEEARKMTHYIESQLRAEKGKLSSLLKKVGAEDEEDFRKRAEDYKRWEGLREKATKLHHRLLGIAGSTETLAEFDEKLLSTTEDELLQKQAGLESNLVELEKQRESLTQRRGGLLGEAKRMEDEEELSQLLLEEQTLQQEIRESVKRWASLLLAYAFLDSTRETYERERKPAVIAKAENYLREMIGERYRIIAPVESETVLLEDALRRRLVEKEWSSGLADQVYLAVRLAFATEFSHHLEPLPIILDDVIVRFDPRRRQGGARLIVKLASQNQVLLFTCEPELAELMKRFAEANATELPGRAFYRMEEGRVAPDFEGTR